MGNFQIQKGRKKGSKEGMKKIQDRKEGRAQCIIIPEIIELWRNNISWIMGSVEVAGR